MKEKLIRRVKQAISDHVFPGCVVGITDTRGTNDIMPFGSLTYKEDAPSVTAGTVYDVASLTKVIPTAALALQFVDQGTLQLTDKVRSFLSAFHGRYADQVTVWHLLTQTLSFSYHLSGYREKAAEEIVSLILTADYATSPGSAYSYSNATSILLGMVVEAVGGKPLDQLAGEHFFKSLGMERSTFFPRSLQGVQIAPTEVDSWRGEVCGVVHDESAYILEQCMIPGSAGLFSTAADLLTFLQMILTKGESHGEQCFSPSMIDQMRRNQLEDIGACTGLGWELNQQWFMGEKASEKTIGKTGFTGCSMIADLERGCGIVLLSNADYPHRPTTRDAINAVRRDVADLVYSYF